ncbi:MAG: hypothetical protein LBH44_04285 [Treponema sp.]|jgi:hypothetical protein|nr:hypothetical protein [Treponema sp.]
MKKILVLGVVAVLLAGGLILASCEEGGCPGSTDVIGSSDECNFTFKAGGTGWDSVAFCDDTGCAVYTQASDSTEFAKKLIDAIADDKDFVVKCDC